MASDTGKIKFTVQTLDERGLQAAAHQLAAQVQQDFRPNIVLGVRTGGYIVADLMMEALPVEAILLPITCRRPSTGKKQKFAVVKDMLQALPQPITDQLRVIEHRMLTQRRPPQPLSAFTPDVDELAQITHLLSLRGGEARVLVVDDAVDSGATLRAVLDTVAEILPPDAVLKSAALTVTTASPLAEPDFAAYRYVLCRFPWSLDFRRQTGSDLRSGRDAAVSE